MLINLSKTTEQQLKEGRDTPNFKILEDLYNLYYQPAAEINEHLNSIFNYLIDHEFGTIQIHNKRVNKNGNYCHVVELFINNKYVADLVTYPYINKQLDARLNFLDKHPLFRLEKSCVFWNDKKNLLSIKFYEGLYLSVIYAEEKYSYFINVDGPIELSEINIEGLDISKVNFYFKEIINREIKTNEDLKELIPMLYDKILNTKHYNSPTSIVFKVLKSPLHKIYQDLVSYYAYLKKDKYANYISSESKLSIILKHINKCNIALMKLSQQSVYFPTFASTSFNMSINKKLKINLKIVPYKMGVPENDNNVKTDYIRLYHNSMIGRLCPCDTPEGQQFGYQVVLTDNASLDQYGHICSRLFNIKTGKIEYINALQDIKICIGIYDEYYSDQEHIYQINKSSFDISTREKIDYLFLSGNSMFSKMITENPLIQFNESTRSIVANSVNKQNIGTLTPRSFLYGSVTKYEQNIDLNTQEIITYFYKNEKIHHYGMITNRLGFISSQFDILNTNCVMAAYVHYKGWNFEDGICMSDRLINSGVLFSEQIKTFKIFIGEQHELSIDIPNNDKSISNLDADCVIKPKSKIFAGDLLVGIIQKKKENQSGDYIQTLLSSLNLVDEGYKNISYYVPHSINEGRVLYVIKENINGNSNCQSYINEVENYYNTVIFKYKDHCNINNMDIIQSNIDDLEKEKIETLKSIHTNNPTQQITIVAKVLKKPIVGDKFAAMHGNKGILSRIIPFEDCPIINDGTGRHIEILVNCVSIAARLNIACLWEIEIGRLKYELEKLPIDFIKSTLKEHNIDFVDAGNSWITFLCKPYLIDVSKIQKIKKIFNIKDHKIINPFTMKEYKNDIAWGYISLIKSVQMVSNKVNARSSGSYSIITQQPAPMVNRDHKVGFGNGMRLGEMEKWGLLAWSCPLTLLESFTLKSDDIKGRGIYTSSLLKQPEIYLNNLTETESLKIFKYNLIISGLSLQTLEVIQQKSKIKNTDEQTNYTNISTDNIDKN